MDLSLMRVFVAIVDHGSFTGASVHLGMNRSQVSRLLKRLEHEMGAQLIRRTTRQMELTQQGHLLHQHAVRALQEIEMGRQLVQSLGAQPKGHVRVSVPTALGDLLLCRMLTEFAQQYEGISVGISLSNRVSDLITSQVDVAVKVVDVVPQDYVARHVATVGWYLCASESYLQQHSEIKTPEDLEQHDFLMPPQGRTTTTLTFTDAVSKRSVKARIKIESESFVYLAQAACQGAGVVLLPSYYATHLIRQKRLVRILEEFTVERAECEIYVLTAPNPYPGTATRAVVDFLMTHLKHEIAHYQ